MKYSIDTNVLIAANGRNTHVERKLAATCARFLLDVQQNHVVLDDNRDEVFSEYLRHLKLAGQPGPGDQFFAWFYRVRFAAGSVERVELPSNTDTSDLIPAELRGFDPSDHKWIALHLLGSGDAVVNATDSDWRDAKALLDRHSVAVLELDDAS